MTSDHAPLRFWLSLCWLLIAAWLSTTLAAASQVVAAPNDSGTPDGWISLFDGKSLDGWQAAEHPQTWRVEDDALLARGQRSHLFYVGDVGNHDFRNFELEVEAKTQPGANSGIYFHTEYQPSGWPDKGYEVQINNSHRGSGNYRELKRTGSLYAVRNIYKSCADDDQWFRIRMMVVGTRIRVWVNDHLTVDYLQPENPPRKAEMAQRLLGHGTIALQGHDPASTVSFRSVTNSLASRRC